MASLFAKTWGAPRTYMEDNEARINFTVERELAQSFDAVLPIWGVKAAVGRQLIRLTVTFLLRHKEAGLGLLLDDRLELRVREDKNGE